MPSSLIYDPERRLTEKFVQDAFHSYLKSSLTQAKAERLLDVEMLSSAESDLMITGPALCLYFAALRCTTNPPSVPLPRISKSSPQLDLSESNCPRPFITFLCIWATAVPDIQSLTPGHQHDLARIVCNLEPISSPLNPNLNRIAADLRAVAIEISQRRSFQDRYATDLQAAIDIGSNGTVRAKASFVPPPVYTPSPTSSHLSLPPSPESTKLYQLEPLALGSSMPVPSPRPSPRTRTSSLASSSSPAIELIRETLYAALADVLEQTHSLRSLLKNDSSRAYFGAVALAILTVSTSAVTADGSVVGVLGQELTLEACPVELRPFMIELGAIGRHAKEVEDEDTAEAMKLAQRGDDIPPPRIERVREMLEKGVGYEGRRGEESHRRSSLEGRAVAFTNRINALALGMTKLRAFRERQDDVFKVLAGIGSS
ncbi:hypothetical protein EW146_g2999 [Bondarzewia mesenterica]|uniref:Uncharacterized protein n=1 Tax=Bondarzewia mesenterica TaxID=1095465 RepID=A0A4S4M0S9_9AGAM|nr:hypothetical protein EW146_g2999 [Bondarzewia mesenterica]